jgi:peptide chain release factor 3
VPNFAPEVLRRIVVSDGLKAKQMNKALTDLSEEGVVQIFRPRDGSWPILGAVGTLQFEVLASRLVAEYGVEARLEAAPYETARWITSDKPDAVQRFCDANRSAIADDHAGSPVFLARSAWVLRRETDDWPDIAFVNVMERN